MTVKQVIGARYVPLFSEPIDWDNTKTYEPLTIVYYGGNSYTSKQAVPKGIDITNTDYWALTGNYNAQIEQYRKEVQAYDSRITANGTAIANETTRAMAEEKVNADAIANETTRAMAEEKVNADAIKAKANTADLGTAAFKDISDTVSNGDKNLPTSNAVYNAITNKKTLIVIGDSYSNNAQTGTPLWYDIYATNKNLNVYTTASDGVGFIAGTNNFQNQLTTAINSINANNVREVIVMGGLNDFATTETPTNIGAAAKNLAANIRAAFPTAEITFALFPPFQYYGYYSNSNIDCNRAKSVMSWLGYSLQTSQVKIIDLSTVGLFSPEFFGPKKNSSGQMHPSQRGSALIASILLGGSNRLLSSAANTDNCPQIKDLKDTSKISDMCHESLEPIYVTKNGYGDMVVMSMEAYEEMNHKKYIYDELALAEEDIKAGRTRDAFESLHEMRKKYGI